MKRAAIGVLIACVAWVGTNARAASTRTWTGSGADNNWGTSANWGSSGPPITDDALIFQGTTRLSPFNNVANLTLSRIGTLTINSTGFSISGNPLQLGGNWSVGYGATWALNSTLNQNISITESRSGSTLTFSGTLDNNANTLTLLGAGNFAFSGAISGSGGLTVNESGTVTLSTANSYSGLTTIAAGTLKLGAANAIPRVTGRTDNYINCSGAGGILNLNGYGLSCNAFIGYGTVTSSLGSPVVTVGSSEAAYDGLGFSGPVTGSTALRKDGTDLFYLDGASSYSGDTTISAGTLQMRATECLPFGSGVGNLSITSGATLDLRGSDTQVNGLAGAGKVSNNSDATDARFTVGNNDASSAFSGAIDDSGGTYKVAVTKTGAGVLTLSGANIYRGDTTVNTGTLVVNGSLGSASAVAVNAGGTLSGHGSVGGSITITDDATAVLYPNSSSTLTVGGDITVDANSTTKFDLSSSAASGNDKVVMNNTTLTITGSPQVTINPTETSLSTADYVLFAVGTSGTISGSFNTIPNWTTPPSFSAGYTVITVGKTVVLHYTAIPISVMATSDSKFYDGTTSASATPTITSGTLDSGDTGVFTESYNDRNVGSSKTLTPTGTIRDSGNADVTSRYNIIWTTANVGSVLDHKEDSGSTTITSANSLTFGLSLNNGKLLADNDPAGASINGAGTITVNTNATLGGTGKVGGATLNSGGTLAPGDNVGSLSTSSETWNANGAYAFQMSSATGTGGSDWDLVSITGNLNIAATITNAFTVKVYTLSGSTPGQAANFDNTLDYQWPIATVTGNITGFDATKFIVDASQFQNATGSGKFSVKLSSDQKSVDLVFTHACGMNLTTSTYAIGADGKVHMYFSNPFGFNTAGGLEARILNNCTITLATAYGPGFVSGQSIGGLPLTVVGQSTSISAGTTRLEVVATKVNGSQSSTVNVLVRDVCGSQGNFDPVFTELKVQQGGVVRQSFSNLPAAEHYVRVVNGTPSLAWMSILVNGQVFALNPLADGQSVLLDVGAAMGEGNTNVLVLAGQGVAGASASITIGDLSVVTGALTPAAVVTGTEAQHWSNLAMAAENPVLQITQNGANLVLSWSDMWDGFEVQTCVDFAPQGRWSPVAASPALNNGQFTVPVPSSSGALFRLYKP